MTMEATRWIALEALLDEWNVPYELVDGVELSEIQTKDYSQVRNSEHRAPKENVEQYALQMSNGAVFPPIVLAANDHAIIDGNTRAAAARRNGWTSFPAYLIKPADGKRARAIGATINMMGGARLSSIELEACASDFLDAGFVDAEIARRLGRTPEWARKFRKRSEFTARAGEHKGAAQIRPLVAEKLADITLDAPLNAVLDAVAAGRVKKLDRPWADKIVDAVRETRSERGAMDAVAAILDEITPTEQGAPPKLRTNQAMARTMKRAEALIDALSVLDVPLVDPLAGQYRDTLVRLRGVTESVLDRMPVVSDVA
ncbi:MAG TPA: ParB N-terminal domain-containing protein [Acidimicrobiales bacterium]